MRKARAGTLTRLLGLLAILAIGTMQQPAEVAAEASNAQTCVGSKGCWTCVASDEEGNPCTVSYCPEHGGWIITCV